MEHTTTYKAHSLIHDTGKKYHVSAYTESRSIPTQFKVFFNIALFGGLRRGEIIALTWDDIDFETNSITIGKSTAFDGNEMITKVPKTRKSKRKITLPQSVMRLIKQYKLDTLRLS